MESGNGIGWNSDIRQNCCDGITPRNINIVVLFSIRTSDFFESSALWHGAAKIETEVLGDNIIFENVVRKNIFDVEKVWHENSIIWY